ncbi:hypothetical protein J437_LFUL017987 [Ladona fulva]|uniref:PiggyBac transposable element-derived protein domain-containing protein n=1 Tax=Ladona fulva TaxID=123851 RepID=A0A8K0P7Y4_LADFU|nr:hypothetical protein J437_LFUL017987 [Ladona fulva]
MPRMRKLDLEEYWSKDWLLSTPAFPAIMSRDRYMLILRLLHFSDNSAPTDSDRLKKIRLVVDSGETTDIEEQGYELGKSGDIVGTLIKPYLEKGHTLFVDNWYSSPALFLWLHNKVTNACGIVRKNRKHMPKMEKLKKGNIQFMCSDILLALKWCNRREVWMLSTCHDSRMLESSKVDYKTGKKIFKPNCVLDNNKRMGAVDKKDMILSSIESVRKTVKWYKKFFFHVVDMSVFNSHMLHCVSNNKKIPMAKCHISLIREMVERFAGPKGRGGGRKSEEDVPLHLSGRHFAKLVTSDACKSILPCKSCLVCKNKKKRRETRHMCDFMKYNELYNTVQKQLKLPKIMRAGGTHGNL